jgi:hypothetical protein
MIARLWVATVAAALRGWRCAGDGYRAMVARALALLSLGRAVFVAAVQTGSIQSVATGLRPASAALVLVGTALVLGASGAACTDGALASHRLRMSGTVSGAVAVGALYAGRVAWPLAACAMALALMVASAWF